MKKFTKYAAALTLTGALALVAATPSYARHWHNAAAAGVGFAAGAIVGAAAANAANGYYYYGPGYYVYDYAYPPYIGTVDSGYYAYAPGYYGPRYYYDSSDVNEHQCQLSPASVDYAPCNNQ